LFKSFLKKTVVILPLLLCLLALEGVNTSAHAAPAAESVHGCQSGYACIYPEGNSETPSPAFYHYGVHRLSNQFNRHIVFNNQTGGALLKLCTDWNGNTCPYTVSPGGWGVTYDLTPINSVVLLRPGSNPPPPPPPPAPAPVLKSGKWTGGGTYDGLGGSFPMIATITVNPDNTFSGTLAEDCTTVNINGKIDGNRITFTDPSYVTGGNCQNIMLNVQYAGTVVNDAINDGTWTAPDNKGTGKFTLKLQP
jgi:hypothetical protein